MQVDKVYNEDALKGLKDIPDNSIDLVVTDPPYNIQSRGDSGNSSGIMTTEISKRGKIFTHNDIDIADWLPDIYRVLKDGSDCYIMVNNFNLIHYLQVIDKSDFHFTRLLVWDKLKKIMGLRYMGQVEFIILCSKGTPKRINDCGTSDLFSIPIKKLLDRNGKPLHPTQKPVKLFETFIKNSSQVGDIVLDPFMGLFTTAVAAAHLDRHFLGFEIDPTFYRLGSNYLKIENQPRLF